MTSWSRPSPSFLVFVRNLRTSYTFAQYRPAKRYFERLYEQRAPSWLSLYEGSCEIFSNLNTANSGRAVFNCVLLRIYFISSFCLTSPCVWLTKFALISEPSMRKVKASFDIFDFPYVLLAINGSLVIYVEMKPGK